MEKRFGLCEQAFEIFYSHSTSQSAGVLVAIKCNIDVHVKYMDRIDGHMICLDVMLVSLTLNCNGLQKQDKWSQV